LDPEEPLSCSAYIADFRALKIKTAFIDELMATPDAPTPAMMFTLDTKSLRDTRSTQHCDIIYAFRNIVASWVCRCVAVCRR
jgi:hypothetical protein